MSSNRFNGFMSGANQFGRWVPDKEIHARAFMGGSTIDFSHALFTEPVITIHSKAMWGGVTIIVPPNVVVEQHGRAIMGAFGSSGGLYHSTGSQATASSNAGIVVKLFGTSVMAGISAVVNKRAEPAQVISRAEAERILREAPPLAPTSQLDVVGDVIGGVLGGLIGNANLARGTRAESTTEQHLAGQQASEAPVRTTIGVVQGVPVHDKQFPTLLSNSRVNNEQAKASNTAVPAALSVQPQDWKQELKELKALVEEGILTQSEFDVEKQKVLTRVR